jgi:cytochrome c6
LFCGDTSKNAKYLPSSVESFFVDQFNLDAEMHNLSHQQIRKEHLMKMKLLVTLFIASAVASLSAADVKENYEKHCTKCHGPDGKGQTKMGIKAGAKDLTDAKVKAEFNDDKAFKGIKEGIKEGDKTKMKAAEGLSDDEIKALVAHVKTFK